MLMTLYTCSQEPKLQLRSLEDDKDLVLALSVASSDSLYSAEIWNGGHFIYSSRTCEGLLGSQASQSQPVEP